MKFDIEDLANILAEDGVWNETAKKQLQKIIQENRKAFPKVFSTEPQINWPNFN
ncbi:MAG: hypothetical protein U5N85_05475 [Arcicella sp.]|nr:hypothetical protein [Arcicella sp.]